jgi:hypothetical protein
MGTEEFRALGAPVRAWVRRFAAHHGDFPN